MKKIVMMASVAMLCLCGCSKEIRIAGYSDSCPKIFPDYRNVTVPANIAPLNFEVCDAGQAKDWALKIETGNDVHHIRAYKGAFTFGHCFWKRLLEDAKGNAMTLTLCEKTDSGWYSCEPFIINVAAEEMDSHLVYRLIPPGYSLWKEMGIYQRDLTSFKETAIYRNTQGRGNCVNCHSFNERNPDQMLFHMRSELAGTYIYRDGMKEKLDTKTDETISALVYPYWHDTGSYVAFSVNRTNQTLHVRNRNQIEVFDEASDVVVYDVDNHKIITADILSSEGVFETFPTFSPDGRSLYFCSAEAVGPMPEKFREAKYSLCRVDFNPEDCSFGTEVDTLYNARTHGRSVSFPRISPDGKMLVFALSDYGNFSIWHKDADLYSIDLATGETVCMDALNSDDVESYHSWSSNSRWLVFSSRRDDGLYTKPYFSYIDEDGRAHKPFLLPQKNPRRYYDSQMYAYNIPEFVNGKVSLKGSEIAEFAREGKPVKLGYEKK